MFLPDSPAMNTIIAEISRGQMQPDRADFKVGDGVRVHAKVREGDKERVQIFSGIVIARKGRGGSETFTVRRISYGEGVERVFPVHSPNITKIEVDREAVTQKARLYYLRKRIGKQATTVKERRLLEAAGAIDATSSSEAGLAAAEAKAEAAAKAEAEAAAKGEAALKKVERAKEAKSEAAKK
jgi:large subunit ribosomal protein L19